MASYRPYSQREETLVKTVAVPGPREKQLAQAVDAVLNQGCHVIVIAGKTGHGKSFFAEEVAAVLQSHWCRHHVLLNMATVPCQHVKAWEDFINAMATALHVRVTHNCSPEVEIKDALLQGVVFPCRPQRLLLMTHLEGVLGQDNLGSRVLDFLVWVVKQCPLVILMATTETEFVLHDQVLSHLVRLKAMTEEESINWLRREIPEVDEKHLRTVASSCLGRHALLAHFIRRFRQATTRQLSPDEYVSHSARTVSVLHPHRPAEESRGESPDDVIKAFRSPEVVLQILAGSSDPRDRKRVGRMKEQLRTLSPSQASSVLALSFFRGPAKFGTAARVMGHATSADLACQTLQPLQQRSLVDINWMEREATLDPFVDAYVKRADVDSWLSTRMTEADVGKLAARCILGRMLQGLERPVVEETEGHALDYRYGKLFQLRHMVMSAIEAPHPFRAAMQVLKEEEAGVLTRLCRGDAVDFLSRMLRSSVFEGDTYERHFLTGLLATTTAEVKGSLNDTAETLRTCVTWFSSNGACYSYEALLFKRRLAWIELRRRRYSDCARLLDEAEATAVPPESLVKAQHQRLQLDSHRAILLTSLGKIQEAKELLLKRLEVVKSVFPHLTLLPVMEDTLALVYARENDLETAAAYYKLSLKRRRRQAVANPGYLATGLINMGELCQRMRRYEEAERLLEEALELRRNLGWRQEDTSIALEYLGVNFALRGDYSSAVSKLAEAVSIRKCVTPRFEDTIRTQVRHAHALLAQRKWKAAQESIEEAWEMCDVIRESRSRSVYLQRVLHHKFLLAVRHRHLGNRLSGRHASSSIEDVMREVVVELERQLEAWREVEGQGVQSTLTRLEDTKVQWQNPSSPPSPEFVLATCQFCRLLGLDLHFWLTKDETPPPDLDSRSPTWDPMAEVCDEDVPNSRRHNVVGDKPRENERLATEKRGGNDRPQQRRHGDVTQTHTSQFQLESQDSCSWPASRREQLRQDALSDRDNPASQEKPSHPPHQRTSVADQISLTFHEPTANRAPRHSVATADAPPAGSPDVPVQRNPLNDVVSHDAGCQLCRQTEGVYLPAYSPLPPVGKSGDLQAMAVQQESESITFPSGQGHFPRRRPFACFECGISPPQPLRPRVNPPEERKSTRRAEAGQEMTDPKCVGQRNSPPYQSPLPKSGQFSQREDRLGPSSHACACFAQPTSAAMGRTQDGRVDHGQSSREDTLEVDVFPPFSTELPNSVSRTRGTERHQWRSSSSKEENIASITERQDPFVMDNFTLPHTAPTTNAAAMNSRLPVLDGMQGHYFWCYPGQFSIHHDYATYTTHSTTEPKMACHLPDHSSPVSIPRAAGGLDSIPVIPAEYVAPNSFHTYTPCCETFCVGQYGEPCCEHWQRNVQETRENTESLQRCHVHHQQYHELQYQQCCNHQHQNWQHQLQQYEQQQYQHQQHQHNHQNYQDQQHQQRGHSYF